MTPLESVNARPAGHTHESSISADDAQCPYCGQSISRKEYREIQARIADEERARIADVEKGLQEKFARERKQAEAKKVAEIEKAKRDAAKGAEQQVKALKATLETTITERVTAQREASEKKLAEVIAAERTKAYGERMKLDAQLADLQRQLQRRTANELGDEGEIDLFEALIAEFPQDQITRVPKGVPGVDIIQRVFSGGVFTNRSILYDCKNHKRWQNKFTTKLREDQMTYRGVSGEQADHAVLVSTVFPADTRQLLVRDGVIVASPARVIAVAHMLRRQVLQAYALNLNNADRDEKTARLYEFMTSDRAAGRWDRMAQATTDLLDIEKSDAVWQEKTRTKRTGLIHTVQSVYDEFTGDIDRILASTETL